MSDFNCKENNNVSGPTSPPTNIHPFAGPEQPSPYTIMLAKYFAELEKMIPKKITEIPLSAENNPAPRSLMKPPSWSLSHYAFHQAALKTCTKNSPNIAALVLASTAINKLSDSFKA